MYFNTQFYSAILLTGVSCVVKWNEKKGCWHFFEENISDTSKHGQPLVPMCGV
jgi:hypothetical protein